MYFTELLTQSKMDLNQSKIEFEKKYVQDVYEKIADEFDQSRYNIWPSVQKFLDNIPKKTKQSPPLKLLEVGSGNGKNLAYIQENLPHISAEGCDMCQKFVDIARRKELKCIRANNLNLPYEDDTFDYVLSVAVIHHFSTVERRMEAIRELLRVLKKGGQLFIQVWAFEQPAESKKSFQTQDELVSWKGKEDRYYHLYKKGDLEKEINDTKINCVILNSDYDYGNWICTIKKA